MLEGGVTLCIVSLNHPRWPEKTSEVEARYQPCHFPANSSSHWYVQIPPAIRVVRLFQSRGSSWILTAISQCFFVLLCFPEIRALRFAL